MPVSTRPLTSEEATQACASCRAAKRKCDRGFPTCSLCSKKDIRCNYNYSKSDDSKKGISNSWPYTPDSQSDCQATQTIDFPSLLFLDPRVLQHGQIDMPQPPITVPEHILHLLGDIGDIAKTASKYFDTIHIWMPIVSKKRFYELHLHPSFQQRPDLALLFLCMKLVADFPPAPPQSPRTAAYLAAKHFYVDVENSGITSVQVLQAGVLLSLYELGHAIYPAAFLTIGACERYSHVRGVNRNMPAISNQALTWVEVEEKRRVWWATIILDRFLSIGCPGRPFATEDPQSADLLPSDDAAWDLGTITPDHPFTLSSPMSSHMSKFGLVCQAARLLGQVLSHICRDVSDWNSHEEEGMLLDRTINAMISAAEDFESPDYDQIAFGYGTLMVLHEPRPISNNHDAAEVERSQRAQTALEAVSKRVIIGLPDKMPHVSRNLENMSPWGIFLGYRSCVTHLQLSRQTSDPDMIQAVQLLKQTLNILDPRWRSAGAYLQVLEAREVMGIL